MSQSLTQSGCCGNTCDESSNVPVPGPQGVAGTNGTNGTDGEDAYTTTTGFVQPAPNATVNIPVLNSEIAAVGVDAFAEIGGYYLVTAIPDATHITLKNLGYTANAPVTTVIPNGARIRLAGEKGETGDVDANGALMILNNLSDLNNTGTALTNLGGTTAGKAIFALANPSAITFIRINADNTITARSAANFRVDLGLVIGTNVQAFDTDLAAIAALVSAADRIAYATGAGTWAITAFTGFARTLVDDADAPTARVTLGKLLPRYGLLGQALAANVNSVADTSIAIEATRYRIDKVVVEAATINLTTAQAAVYTAAAAGGAALALPQALSALTASTKFKDLTLEAVVGTDVLTAGTLFFRNTTAQGAAATVNVHIFGMRLD